MTIYLTFIVINLFQIAALSSGLLADKFGRRHVIMGSILLVALSSLGIYFVHDYIGYVILEIFLAFGITGN